MNNQKLSRPFIAFFAAIMIGNMVFAESGKKVHISETLRLMLEQKPHKQRFDVVISFASPVSHELGMEPTFATGKIDATGGSSYLLNGRSVTPETVATMNNKIRRSIVDVQTKKQGRHKKYLQAVANTLGWRDLEMKKNIASGVSAFRRTLWRSELERLSSAENLNIASISLPTAISYGLASANNSMGTTTWAHPYECR